MQLPGEQEGGWQLPCQLHWESIRTDWHRSFYASAGVVCQKPAVLQVALTDKGRAGLAWSINSIVGRVEGCLW